MVAPAPAAATPLNGPRVAAPARLLRVVPRAAARHRLVQLVRASIGAITVAAQVAQVRRRAAGARARSPTCGAQLRAKPCDFGARRV